MPKPFSGVWIWIWELGQCDGGDLAAIAARCKAAGVAGVIVKAADGGRWFPQPLAVSDIVGGLKARGIGCATWDYLYLSDAGAQFYGYTVDGWEAEAAKVSATINAASPDFHVLDVEGETEQLADPAGRAQAFLARLKSLLQSSGRGEFPIAYAPLPAIRYHLRLPYRQFSDYPMPMLPQTYWTALKWPEAYTLDLFLADARQYGLLGQPVYPIYADYEDAAAGVRRPTADEVADFGQRVKAIGTDGVSVWSYQHLNAAAWERIAALCQVFPAGAAPVDPCADVRAQLEEARATLAQIHTLSGGSHVQRKTR
jgi:hypothetical protein